MNKDCVFCKKIREELNITFPGGDDTVIYFEPLNPVTPGHLLIVPTKHVEDFSENINVSSRVMAEAAILAKNMGDCNLITSKGEFATQTIKHLHIHLIPRRKGDNLKLPWSLTNNT